MERQHHSRRGSWMIRLPFPIVLSSQGCFNIHIGQRGSKYIHTHVYMGLYSTPSCRSKTWPCLDFWGTCARFYLKVTFLVVNNSHVVEELKPLKIHGDTLICYTLRLDSERILMAMQLSTSIRCFMVYYEVNNTVKWRMGAGYFPHLCLKQSCSY